MDSTVNRAHQNDTNLNRTTGGTIELHESAQCEPLDYAIGRSRDSLTTRIHPLCNADANPRPRPRPLMLQLEPRLSSVSGGSGATCGLRAWTPVGLERRQFTP